MGAEAEFDPAAWRRVLAADPSYGEQVLPLMLELLDPRPGDLILDLGCGEGRAMRALAARATVIGCDLSFELLTRARHSGPVVQGRLPWLDWLAPETVDAAFAMLVLEHLGNPAALFGEVARVVKAGGSLVLVRNHPAVTAPGSAPILDPADGEVLWRWGRYLTGDFSDEELGGSTTRFHHQSLGQLLTAAAGAGWALATLVEAPLRSRDPLLELQAEVPRLLGVRWRKALSP